LYRQNLYSSGGTPPVATAVHVIGVPTVNGGGGDEVRELTETGVAAVTANPVLFKLDS
jgi:hypothetical protein